MRRAFLIFALVLVVFFLGYVGVPFVVDWTTRGKQLTDTSGNLDPADGSVQADPEDLAALASDTLGRAVDVDAYGAARMVRSEEPRVDHAVQELLVHVALNDAREHGWTLLQAVTVSSVDSRSGLFGTQKTRRYSTREDPFERDLYVAEKARADHQAGIDPTGGCVKFFDKGGIATGGRSFDDVAASWAKEGLSQVAIDPAPSRLVFFRRAA